jgi:hypothetical protein
MADLLQGGDYIVEGGNDGFVMTSFAPGGMVPLEYAVTEWRANPSVRSWPYMDMHDGADPVIDGFTTGPTEAAARAELVALMDAFKPGATLLWQPDGQTYPVMASIAAADVSVTALDPSTRFDGTSAYIPVKISISLFPYWLAAPYLVTLDVPVGVPFVAELRDDAHPHTGGDIPALVKWRVTSAQASSRFDLALRSNPAAGFAPILVYGDVTDADAFADEHCADLTMGTEAAAIGTAESVDVAAMTGDFVAIARVKSSGATPANVKLNVVSTVTPAVGPAFSLTGPDVSPITTAEFECVDLGPMSVPAGRVEAGLSGTMLGPEALVSSLETGVTPTALSTTGIDLGTVTVVDGRARIAVDAMAAVAPTTYRLGLFDGATLVVGTPGFAATGSFNYQSTYEFDVIAGTYTLRAWLTSSAAVSVLTNSAHTLVNYKLYERPLIAQGATVSVLARQTGATNNIRIDTLALLPTDEGYASVQGTFAAGEGVCLDYSSPNATQHDCYICNATATGISLVGSMTPLGPPMLPRPGDNLILGMVWVPGDEPPGQCTIVAEVTARHLLPYTGE